MDKEKDEKENTSEIMNQGLKNSKDNEDIEVIIETDSHVDDNPIFEDPAIPILIDVDSNMYGGPFPEYFLQDEIDMTDLIDFGSNVEPLFADDMDSDDERKDKDTYDLDDFIG